MDPTIWALLPPLIAIIASLITKEVNLSLALGLFAGAGIYAHFDPFATVRTAFEVMSSRVYGNMGVLIFIILLGMIVHLMNKSGATRKYALWASRRIKNRKQTLLATALLGIIIFVDDYFNCLTVGTIMRPLTDRNHISREKLAYIIDSTAAPICMIAPVSSWAAAVSSSLPDDSSIDGFRLFLKTIPANFYSLLALVLIFGTIFLDIDFGKMRRCEAEARERDMVSDDHSEDTAAGSPNSRVSDLVLPVAGLIAFSLISMLYTGGLFSGTGVAEAFANCDAITGLAMGAFYTVIFVALLYLPRKIVTVREYLDGLVEGFKNMVPATLILSLAWSISGICGSDYLNAGGYVAKTVSEHSVPLAPMPALFFVIAVLLAFSTGTSWGTFGIMLPIAISVFGDQEGVLTVLTTAAILSGSVCGDHLSPISDTTILSSTAAGCDHYQHFTTQFQYGLLVAAVSTIGFLVAGFAENIGLGFQAGFVSLSCCLLVSRKFIC